MVVAEDKPSEKPLLRTVVRDDEPMIQVRCPNCGSWGDIDGDQLHGRALTQHVECGFVDKRDWFTEGEWVEGRGPDEDIIILRGPE
jgi:hypothetical protein